MGGSHAENVIAHSKQNLLSRFMKKNRAKEDLQMKMKYFNASIVPKPKHSNQNVMSKDMKRSLLKIEEVVFDPHLNQTVHFIHK